MYVLCTFKIKIDSQKLEYGTTKDQWPYPNQDQDANPFQEPPASPKALNQNLKDMYVLCTFKIKIESQNSDHGCIKDQNEDLTDMDVLCTFKIKIESQNSEYGCTKDQWQYQNQYQDAKPQSWASSVLQSRKWGLKGLGCS